MAAATTATITAPCGVDLDDDYDDGGHSAAWAEHLRECGSCNRWDIDREDKD